MAAGVFIAVRYYENSSIVKSTLRCARVPLGAIRAPGLPPTVFDGKTLRRTRTVYSLPVSRRTTP